MRMPVAAACRIFDVALEAVLPPAMVRGHLRRHGDSLIVGQKSYNLTKNVYVVGFGKAVTGMCRVVQDVLGDHIVKGILSVPVGTRASLTNTNKRFLLPLDDGKIAMYEGAMNNLPDERSHDTTMKIQSMAHSLSDQDILLTLVSGGGSALLCSPLPPITLKEKTDVTTVLAKQGATIQELNTVRRHLSQVKGGGLAKAAFPAQVISLILSDIIGDPLDLIASGPTVSNCDEPGHCTKILEKFNAQDKVPDHITDILKTLKSESSKQDFPHVQNVLVGTNNIAVEGAMKKAEDLGYDTVILSKQISGEAKDVGALFIDIAKHISDSVATKSLNDFQDPENNHFGHPSYSNFAWKSDITKMFKELSSLSTASSKLCIIGAGETTVTVQGDGKGGRNQEMVLSAAIQYFNQSASFPEGVTIAFLSAGTDGQDGPTDVAGAVFDNGCDSLIKNELECFEARNALANNDSYHFLQKRPRNVLTTGVTGTNVMDIHILTVELS